MSARERQTLSDELLDEFDASILMLGRLMAARHGEACEGTTVSGPRLLVLRLLDAHGSKAGELASLLGVKAPAVTSLIDGLEKEGLVSREHSADDRRVVLVTLTSEGRTALREAEAVRRRYMRQYLAALTEADVRDLIRIQRTVIRTIFEMDA